MIDGVGVAAEQDENGGWGVMSQNAWMRGSFALFRMDEGSTMRIRLKMERPAWFNVVLVARSAAAASTSTRTYVYQDDAWWQGLEPGEWRTIEMDLGEPLGINPSRGDQNSPEGWVCFALVVSSQQHDRGMVVERIWVSGEGP